MTIALNALTRAQFDVGDVIRRAQGDLVGAFGLNPSECLYRTIASHSYWGLRDFGGGDQSPSLLIIAAPIKKPYIWDLTPSISSIRFCLHQGLHVQLLEWMSTSSHASNYGIDECVLAISEAVATITAVAKGAKPCMIGHSLGGTLAAIYGAFQPETIKGLVLLGAPLCFEPSKSQFRDALISLVPRKISEGRDVSRFALVTRERSGISKYIYLVAPDRCGTECWRSSGDGYPCASGALDTR